MNEWMNEWMNVCMNNWMGDWVKERQEDTRTIRDIDKYTGREKRVCLLFEPTDVNMRQQIETKTGYTAAQAACEWAGVVMIKANHAFTIKANHAFTQEQ